MNSSPVQVSHYLKKAAAHLYGELQLFSYDVLSLNK